MALLSNLVIRKQVPLHMLTGYPTENRFQFLQELLKEAPASECIGVIQSLSPLEHGQVLPVSHHPIETMETQACICCDVYVLFYGRLSRMLGNGDLTRIVVDLEPRAEPQAMLKMLMSSPLGLQIIPQKTMLTWNANGMPLPEWVEKHERRLWADAEIVLTPGSSSLDALSSKFPKDKRLPDMFVGSSRELALQFWQNLPVLNTHSPIIQPAPVSVVQPRNKLVR